MSHKISQEFVRYKEVNCSLEQ